MNTSIRRRLPILPLVILAVSAQIAPSSPLRALPEANEAARSQTPLAEVVVSAGRVEWPARPGAAGVEERTLAVADPTGKVHSHTFARGETPMFPGLDAESPVLPDGLYTYELREVEPAPEREAGDEARRYRLQAERPQPGLQSGTFRVENGAVVQELDSEPREGSLAKDQTVPDDLIVDGKGCVGLGCAANEAFGNEALRLKQSVVRLRFEDTSSQPGFASTDWQLTANDVGSGGANRFSLEDLTSATTPVTVRGGAPNSSLYVDPSGNLGFGTAVPAQKLHAVATSTPALRLEQSGGTPRTWDLSASNSSFRLTDVTNSSAVPMQVAAGAPTNSWVVGSNGYVGSGVNPPTAPFHVVANNPSNVIGRVQNTSSTGYSGIEFVNHQNLTVFFFGVDNAGGFTRLNSIQQKPLILMTESEQRLKIMHDGKIALGGLATPTHPLHHANGAHLTAGGVWTNASSRALKQDIHDLDSKVAVAALEGLKPVQFAYKADPEEHHVGFIAEDVPELVAEKGREGLSPMDVVAVLTKVVQEQQGQLAAQAERLKTLEARLAALDEKR